MLEEKLKEFERKRILVIGDVMLDKYIVGDVERISPEAPVPVVHIKHEYKVLGGAANVANNIISLGGNVSLIGIIGQDTGGKDIIRICKGKNIEFQPAIIDDYQTIQKIRVLSQNQQLIRMDYEDKKIDAQEELIRRIRRNVADANVIVVSDYAKGTVSKGLMDYLKKESKSFNKKIIVDPKPINKKLYKNVYLITPNAKEAIEMHGREINITRLGQNLSKELSSNILITRGEQGMSLFDRYNKTINIPTRARQVYDVSGAGDTVVATMALCIASGLDLKTSSEIANYAAGIVVGKVGTATTTREEILTHMEKYKQ